MTPRAIVALLLLLTGVVPAPLVCGRGPSGEDDQTRKIASLLVDYRRARDDAERRTEIALELSGIGADAVARLGKQIDGEIGGIEKRLQKLQLDPRVDQQIARLRGVLAELRAEPELTGEMLKEVGDPSLDQLKVLVAMSARQRQQLFAESERSRTELTALGESCKRLQQAWQGSEEPLPVTEYLARIEAIDAQTSPTPLEQRGEEVTAHNAQFMAKLPANVLEGMAATNQIRFLCGLAPLEIDPKLCQAAWGHSDDMRRLEFFSHESPVEGKKTFTDRAQQAGTTAAAENIFAGSRSGKAAVEAWFHSPGHHKLILGDFRRFGLGNSGQDWTMLLGS